MISVCVVLVTYNRLDKLKDCLNALKTQIYAPKHVIVIDNASTDGTADFLTALTTDPSLVFSLTHKRLPTNLGGAGGFNHGLHLFLQTDYQAAWLMDDDSLPAPTALQALSEAVKKAHAGGFSPAVLASQVLWTDGNLHPWNIPQPLCRKSLACFSLIGLSMLPIRSASFVSLLIQRTAVEKYGLPLRDYFIYNDDLEYTGRILRHETGVLVPASLCVHNTTKESTHFILPPERLRLEIRNKLWMILYSPAWTAKERLRHGLILGKNILIHLLLWRRLPHTIKGIGLGFMQALTTRPKG